VDAAKLKESTNPAVRSKRALKESARLASRACDPPKLSLDVPVGEYETDEAGERETEEDGEGLRDFVGRGDCDGEGRQE
jgi:hypothetical protein